jgi:hypothetical protein
MNTTVQKAAKTNQVCISSLGYKLMNAVNTELEVSANTLKNTIIVDSIDASVNEQYDTTEALFLPKNMQISC